MQAASKINTITMTPLLRFHSLDRFVYIIRTQ